MRVQWCRGFRKFGGGGGGFGQVSKFKGGEGLRNFQDPGGLGSIGGWQIFRIQGDGLCWTMTFSREVQTPEDTMVIQLKSKEFHIF